MKKRIIAIILIILIIPAIFLQNRNRFGVWDPSQLPDRVQCYGRIYKKSNGGVMPEDNETLYEISFSDCFTLKELYSRGPKGEYVPTVIYLKTDGNSYIGYELSGGP